MATEHKTTPDEAVARQLQETLDLSAARTVADREHHASSPAVAVMEREQKRVHPCNVLVLGDWTVGKTSLLVRLTQKTFRDTAPCLVGVDRAACRMAVDDDLSVQLVVHDTAGQERFRALPPSFYRQPVDGVLLVYDVTQRTSFEHVNDWVRELELYLLPQRTRKPPVIVLVGNKADVSAATRQVKVHEGQELADRHKWHFLEASAKDGTHVDAAFATLCTAILRRRLAEVDVVIEHSDGGTAPVVAPPPCACG